MPRHHSLSLRSRLLRGVAVAAALGALAVLSGCSDPLEKIDPNFSAQLIELQEGWPGETLEDSDLSKAEKEAYKEYGPPDVIRILFDKRGDVVLRERALRKAKDMEKEGIEFSTLDRAWIYLTRDLEIRFVGLTAERHPITPKVRTLVEYGDPHKVSQVQGTLEKWSYFDAGRIFTFEGDKLISTESQPPTNFTRF